MKVDPILKTIRKTLQQYFETRQEIIAAYLYGSYAGGRQNDRSDLDIALLTAPFKNQLESFSARTRYQTELSTLLRKNTDVVFLQETGEILSYQILKKGQLLFESDRTAHQSFKASKLIQCLDFQFLERRMRKGMIAAMRRENIDR